MNVHKFTWHKVICYGIYAIARGIFKLFHFYMFSILGLSGKPNQLLLNLEDEFRVLEQMWKCIKMGNILFNSYRKNPNITHDLHLHKVSNNMYFENCSTIVYNLRITYLRVPLILPQFLQLYSKNQSIPHPFISRVWGLGLKR